VAVASTISTMDGWIVWGAQRAAAAGGPRSDPRLAAVVWLRADDDRMG